MAMVELNASWIWPIWDDFSDINGVTMTPSSPYKAILYAISRNLVTWLERNHNAMAGKFTHGSEAWWFTQQDFFGWWCGRICFFFHVFCKYWEEKNMWFQSDLIISLEEQNGLTGWCFGPETIVGMSFHPNLVWNRSNCGNIRIPTDELICHMVQRGWYQPPSRMKFDQPKVSKSIQKWWLQPTANLGI